jgi:hypothetical protein
VASQFVDHRLPEYVPLCGVMQDVQPDQPRVERAIDHGSRPHEIRAALSGLEVLRIGVLRTITIIDN